MLVPTVLLPSVITANPDESGIFYNSTIELFRKLEKKGVFLIEDRDRLNHDIGAMVKKWPPKYSKKIQTILKKIDKTNRFVELDIDDTINTNCPQQQCQSYIRITTQHLPEFVLARLNCYSCAKTQMADIFSVKVVNSDEYAIEDEFCAVMEKSDRVFAKGVKLKQFEQEIILPMFRYAKHVKIYDRYVGRSIVQKNNAPKYKSMLQWLLKVFANNSRKGCFKVYCGLETEKLSKSKVDEAKIKLKELEENLKIIYPKIELSVKEETKEEQFQHDRYIITDQLAISMGRGICLVSEELSSPEDLLLDFNIACCSEPGKIEAAVRNLPDCEKDPPQTGRFNFIQMPLC
ncbi:MAG: hypothetical protein EBE86_002175 [Hormoscilla sp. GUM202]|nr:hypothetical protein [Hormoscilla sp. GUM202]